MSIVCEPEHRSAFLDEAAGWARRAGAVFARPKTRVSTLSDRHLADIGMRPRSLSSRVAQEIGKPGLVDFGWRLGR